MRNDEKQSRERIERAEALISRGDDGHVGTRFLIETAKPLLAEIDRLRGVGEEQKSLREAYCETLRVEYAEKYRQLREEFDRQLGDRDARIRELEQQLDNAVETGGKVYVSRESLEDRCEKLEQQLRESENVNQELLKRLSLPLTQDLQIIALEQQLAEAKAGWQVAEMDVAIGKQWEQQLKAAQERLADVMSRLDTWADDLEDSAGEEFELQAAAQLIVPEMRTSLKEYFAKHSNRGEG